MGDPEIHHLGATIGHEDVGGFEVTVDNPDGSHCHEGLGKADRQPYEALTLQWAIGVYEVEQVAAGDVFGNQVGVLGVKVSSEVAGGAHAADPLSGLDFTGEARPK